MSEATNQTHHLRIVIIYMPTLLCFLTFALLLLLTPMFKLPWRVFSGIVMSSLKRLVELILGQILTILAVMCIVLGC